MIRTVILFSITSFRWLYYIQNRNITQLKQHRILRAYGCYIISEQFFYKLKFDTSILFFTTDPNYFVYAKFNVFLFRSRFFYRFWRTLNSFFVFNERRTLNERNYVIFIRINMFSSRILTCLIIDRDFSNNFEFNEEKRPIQSWDFSMYFENFVGLYLDRLFYTVSLRFYLIYLFMPYTKGYAKKITHWAFRISLYIFCFYFFYDEHFTNFLVKLIRRHALVERIIIWKNYIHILKEYKYGKME